MHQLLGEFVDDVFDLGELGGLEFLVADSMAEATQPSM